MDDRWTTPHQAGDNRRSSVDNRHGRVDNRSPTVDSCSERQTTTSSGPNANRIATCGVLALTSCAHARIVVQVARSPETPTSADPRTIFAGRERAPRTLVDHDDTRDRGSYGHRIENDTPGEGSGQREERGRWHEPTATRSR